MSNPCVSILELLGLFVGTMAWFCSLAATLMPHWLTLSTELLVVESYHLGLWETCVVQEVAGTECRPFDSLLGLPHSLTLARVLVCVSDAIGVLSILIAVPGLSIVKCCGGSYAQRMKRGMKITSGILFVTTAILVIVPISYVAQKTVEKFFDETVPHVVPRWEFGDALFVGWSAGFLYVVSALLFFASCLGMGNQELDLEYHYRQENVKTVKATDNSKMRSEYV